MSRPIKITGLGNSLPVKLLSSELDLHRGDRYLLFGTSTGFTVGAALLIY